MSRRLMRKKTEYKIKEQIEKTEKADETNSAADPSKQSTEKPLDSPSQPVNQPILMVEVVNVTHEKFKQTEEIKVTQID